MNLENAVKQFVNFHNHRVRIQKDDCDITGLDATILCISHSEPMISSLRHDIRPSNIYHYYSYTKTFSFGDARDVMYYSSPGISPEVFQEMCENNLKIIYVYDDEQYSYVITIPTNGQAHHYVKYTLYKIPKLVRVAC